MVKDLINNLNADKRLKTSRNPEHQQEMWLKGQVSGLEDGETCNGENRVLNKPHLSHK